MTKYLFHCVLCVLLVHQAALAQNTNLLITDPEADAIVKGNYDPADYPATWSGTPQELIAAMRPLISPDSLRENIIRLSEFGTRNTGSDTLSDVTGIGAARRWIHAKFQEIHEQGNGRLIPAYFQFDRAVCGMDQHRNVLAVLPGTQADPHEIIIIEGHMDSRCDVSCDVDCPAEGVEDNASGTALVMELARVMSGFTFKHTLVFMATTGEEQGLIGAEAFAQYCTEQGISVKAVLNNDVIGGVICGKTASPPGCMTENDVDSTQVRLFSADNFNSPHKALARYVKLQYEEELKAGEAVPMTITLMSPEDRTGRGGDHIPFRVAGYPAIRFTSANEHGDASNGPDYMDRQHTSEDILGVDTDGDQVIDSFFVDFRYLSRNAAINATAAAMAALSPKTPSITVSKFGLGKAIIEIDDPEGYGVYRIGRRLNQLDFDVLFTTTKLIDTFATGFGVPVWSAASVDEYGVESLFTPDYLASTTAIEETHPHGVELLQNRPNPFDEATWIQFLVHQIPDYSRASVVIRDASGTLLADLPVVLTTGINEVLYTHGYGVSGMLFYSLVLDGMPVGTKAMVFAN
ncbi:MAG: M28 family peptidase [Lewinellaceae bacterium]|nr:M28 family peptidase [Saprospiraceae bacterium]MCB9311801.1 M28 family peptidase [Lewinellaceae bacterium]